jgi:hypothetical protein
VSSPIVNSFPAVGAFGCYAFEKPALAEKVRLRSGISHSAPEQPISRISPTSAAAALRASPDLRSTSMPFLRGAANRDPGWSGQQECLSWSPRLSSE